MRVITNIVDILVSVDPKASILSIDPSSMPDVTFCFVSPPCQLWTKVPMSRRPGAQRISRLLLSSDRRQRKRGERLWKRARGKRF